MSQRRQIASLRGVNRVKNLSELRAPRPAPSPWRSNIKRYWEDLQKADGMGQTTKPFSPKQAKPFSPKLAKPFSPKQVKLSQGVKKSISKSESERHDETKVLREHTILWHICTTSKEDPQNVHQPNKISPRMRVFKTSMRRRTQFSPSLTPVAENLEQDNISSRGTDTSSHSKSVLHRKKNITYNQKRNALSHTPRIKSDNSFQTLVLSKSKKILPALPMLVIGQHIETRLFK